MNVQKIAGVGLALLGLVVGIMDFEAVIRHAIGDGMGRFFGYGAMGALGIGMLLIDSNWVFSMAQKCASFLPWSKGQSQ